MFTKMSRTVLAIVFLISLLTLLVNVGILSLIEGQSRQLFTLLLIGGSCWAVEMLILLFFIKKLTTPLEEMTTILTTTTSSNPDLSAFTQSKNEVGKLALVLTKQFQQCQRDEELLEQKVMERTQQIQQELLEEKKMNELMVGREIMMNELKTEIKRLKGME